MSSTNRRRPSIARPTERRSAATGGLGALGALLAALAGCAHGQSAEADREPKVRAIRFEGNPSFSASTLRAQLATEATAWWPFASARRLDIAALDLDMRRIPAYYADRGFFDARVVHRRIDNRPDGSVVITLALDEGKPTLIAEVKWVGPGGGVVPDEPRWRKVAADAGVAVGQRADYASYEATKNRIQALLNEDGFAYAHVTGDLAVDRDQHRATITYTLAPGPLVRLGPARLEGQGRIPAWKLMHRVAWTPGETYTPDLLATTQGRLYDLGVFSSVRLELPPEPTPTPDVTIKLSPGKLRELKLGGGLGIDRDREEARLQLEWSFSNFLGGLRKLRLRVKPAFAVIPSITNIQRSGPVLNSELTLIQPDLAGSSVTANVTAGYDVTLTEGYAARGPRGSVGLQRSFLRDRLLGGVAYNLQFFDFYDIDAAVFTPTSTSLGFGFKDPYRLAYLEELVQVDLRNRSVARRPGAFFGLRFEEGAPALGGEFRYLVIVPELKLFVPVTDRVLVALRGLGGWLRPFGGGAATDSPVTRRFRLGGPSSHRGFGFGRLSPQIADPSGHPIPVGGDAQLLLSAEVRVQLLRLAGSWLSAVPFFDAGDVTTSLDTFSLARLHQAAGLAAEYMTPIGVIRAGAAARLNRMSGTVTPGAAVDNPDPGQRFAFHFTIGEAF